jgi:ribosomal protein S12 methylthiotransferase accessory factor
MSAIVLKSHARSDPAETLSKATQLVDPHSGIIRVLYESPAEPDAPQVFGFGSVLADTSRYGVESFGLINGSTSIVREQAAAGAIGEAVERYACRVLPYGDLVWDSFRNLAPHAVDPTLTVLYDNEQYSRKDFPYRPFDVSEPVPWVSAFSLTERKECLLPAVSVFMAAVEDVRRPLVQQTTNGMACGNTIEEAILSGLYEVIERDASMITWFRKAQQPHMNLAHANDPGLLTCLGLFEAAGTAVSLVDITTDTGIPCVLACATLGASGADTPVFATAADLSLQHAARSALEELAQCMPWVKVMMRKRAAEDLKPIERLSTTEDHVMWPTRRSHRTRVSFLTAGTSVREIGAPESPSGNDVLADIEECVARLEPLNMQVVVIDITPPDIADAGLSVVRTVVLNSIPLYFGSGLWRIGARVCTGLLDGHQTDPAAINYFPHPYP